MIIKKISRKNKGRGARKRQKGAWRQYCRDERQGFEAKGDYGTVSGNKIRGDSCQRRGE